MNELTHLPIPLPGRFGSRSMGVKLIVVAGLALLMSIPAFLVGNLTDERSKRASDVSDEISNYAGGPQTFLGPTLSIPYVIPSSSASVAPEKGDYLVFPVQGSAEITTTTTERRRSLFKVPVFQASLHFNASFDLRGIPSSAPANMQLDWEHAVLLVGVKDARGALADGTISAQGKTDTLVPLEGVDGLSPDTSDSKHTELTLFGVSISQLAKPGSQFQIASDLRFSGAKRIAVLAFAKSTTMQVHGDWPNPGFDGGFLPVNRTITPGGFNATWSVPFMARGVRADARGAFLSGLENTALGINFVELADPYQSVNRSLKYALLFLGLVFLAYFIFEVTTGRRVHPAQYVLVGIAQVIFYLLLLSFAERTGFDYGFLVAGSATVLLLSANAAWIFNSRLQGLRALVSFSLLYSLIYLLLRLEDNALLVGAVASFLAIAAVMYFTRKIDWYSSLPAPGGAKTESTEPRDDA